MSVPSLFEARQAIERAYQTYKGLRDGKNADYIPALANADSKLFGLAIAMSNGDLAAVGDSQHLFSIQSVVKAFTLGRLLEDVGPDQVEKLVGLDPTGQPVNSILALGLNPKHPAGNPLTNAGAMAAVGLVKGKSATDRWSRISDTLNGFAGRALIVDPEVFRTETDAALGNRGIAWLLKSNDVVAGEPDEVLAVYTRACSVLVTARDLAVMGATLANGGVNPKTGQRVISVDNSARILAQMMTSGLNETSGTWAFRAGLPAKSGVGGGIVAVFPGRFAIGTFSPPLDDAGNSVRGQRAIESIVKDLGANLFQANPRRAAVGLR